jgi:pyrroloquinoline quinone (PQQ) biosynthesis protein C
MNNDHLPYSEEEISDPGVAANLAFLKSLEDAARRSRVFDHPLLTSLAQGQYPKQSIAAVFGQFAHHVRIFTSCLGHLIGTAPDLRCRVVLLDNLSEELGHGDITRAHYSLYLRMLRSMGMDQQRVELIPTLPSILRLNEQLLAATRASFVQGLAWLGIGGELTIPNNFPYLATAGRRAFEDADLEFFARHGGIDQGHSDDANTLLAMHMRGNDRSTVANEVATSLAARARVWDDLEQMCESLGGMGQG